MNTPGMPFVNLSVTVVNNDNSIAHGRATCINFVGSLIHQINMKKAYFITIVLLTTLAMSCKKSSKGPGNNTNTPRVSQNALLCNEWILSETYEDGVQKTTGGTGKYRFTTDGEFQYYYNNNWTKAGTYQWNDTDSNSISVLFVGTSMSYWWTILKLDDKNYNTEFMSGGTKFNYNYTR